jgi:hypothetical protein
MRTDSGFGDTSGYVTNKFNSFPSTVGSTCERGANIERNERGTREMREK